MDIRRTARYAGTAQRLRDKIQRAGHTLDGKPLWTLKEDDLLRRYHPDYPAMMQALPLRTRNAIRGRVQVIGVARRYKAWTGPDVAKLRKHFPTASWNELLALFPGRTVSEIRAYAQRRAFREKHYAQTGYPIIDAIRERAKLRRWSMPDLDEIANTNGYFAKCRWQKTRTAKYIFRAIEALDGEIAIKWRDY